MDEKRYSVGELAELAQLTVRTLQYYDRIGLLPASRHPDSGRRYYTAADLIRLEQILFYKALGFSLEEIQANLAGAPSLAEMRAIFEKQLYFLLRRMERLHTSFAAIDASLKVLEAGSSPPFEVVLQFLRLLPGEDVFEWGPALLDAEQKASLSRVFKDFDQAQSFYHALKGLMVDALMLHHAGVPPAHLQARELAGRWQALMTAISAGHPQALEQFEQIGASSGFEGQGWREMMEEVYEYIQRAGGGAGEGDLREGTETQRE